MTYHVNPDAYCTVDGCTRPKATGEDVCSQCARLARAVGGDPGSISHPRRFRQPERRRDRLDAAREVSDLDALFALDAAPEADPPKRLSVAEYWERGMVRLDRHEDGTKMSRVAAGLGVDGRELTDLILARVQATIDAINADPEPAHDDPDEDREGWTRAIGNAMAALCLEMWAGGMEAGRHG